MKKEIISSGKLEKKLANFTEEQRKLIFENVGAIELTEGCSIGCPDCGVSALKGVQDYIPPKILSEIFTKYGQNMKNSLQMLYYASEPFDYEFDGKNYLDIHQEYQEKTGKNLSVITALPKGKEIELLERLVKETGLAFTKKTIKSISLTPFNYKRVEKQLIKSDLLNDLKILGIDSLESFGKYINNLTNGYNPIRDFVNENERYNLGQNSKEKLADESIGCFHGILITPSEIFNLQTTTPTKENPTGQIKIPITPENFEVIPFANHSTKLSIDVFLSEGENERLTA